MEYFVIPKELFRKFVKLVEREQDRLQDEHICGGNVLWSNTEDCDTCKLIADMKYTIWEINKWI